MADGVLANWHSLALKRSTELILQRLSACTTKHRPQTRPKLASFIKRNTRAGTCIFSFDPRDCARDLLLRGLLSEASGQDLLKMLEAADRPESGCLEPVSSELWPVGNYGWRRPPSKLCGSSLSYWICSSAYVRVKVTAEQVVSEILGPGKFCQEDLQKQLRYSEEFTESPATTDCGKPWEFSPQKPLKGGLSKSAAMVVCLDKQTETQAYEKVQQVRKQYDPAHSLWMPSISLIHPFLPSKRFRLADIREKISISTLEPFDVCFNDIGSFVNDNVSTYFLKPDENSTKKLKILRDGIIAALPAAPGGSWFVDEEPDKAKSKGKGRKRQLLELQDFPYLRIAQLQKRRRCLPTFLHIVQALDIGVQVRIRRHGMIYKTGTITASNGHACKVGGVWFHKDNVHVVPTYQDMYSRSYSRSRSCSESESEEEGDAGQGKGSPGYAGGYAGYGKGGAGYETSGPEFGKGLYGKGDPSHGSYHYGYGTAPGYGFGPSPNYGVKGKGSKRKGDEPDEEEGDFKRARHKELLDSGPIQFRVARVSLCERERFAESFKEVVSFPLGTVSPTEANGPVASQAESNT